MVYFIHIVGSILVAYLGRNTRFGFWGNFFASLLMTPLVGFILVLAADPSKSSCSKDEGTESP